MSTPTFLVTQSSLGATTDPSSLRSVKETLIRSFAIHFIAAATVGHLMTLQNFSHKRSATLLFCIIAFLLFPMLPLAQVLRQLRSTVALSFNRRRRGLTFYASACCGMYTTKSEQTVETEPIIKTDPERIRRRRASYNALWLGRVVVLLALIVQYCGTAVLWLRRARRVISVRLWAIDTRNLEMALGGLTAVISSLVISLINTEWKIEDQPSDNGVPLSDSPGEGTAPVAQDIITSSEAAAADRSVGSSTDTINASQESAEKSHNANICAGAMFWLSKAKRFYTRFRALSLKASNTTLRIYPSELQWDLELAYLLRLLVSVVIIPIDGFNGGLIHDPRYFFMLRQMYYRFEESFFHAGIGLPWRIPSTYFVMSLYLLPFVIILLHALLWLMASTRLIGFVPKTVGKMVAEVDFWFRSGRTVFSIPLSLLMLLPLYLQILFLKSDFEATDRFKSYMVTMGWSDMGALWKDPLADQLYII